MDVPAFVWGRGSYFDGWGLSCVQGLESVGRTGGSIWCVGLSGWTDWIAQVTWEPAGLSGGFAGLPGTGRQEQHWGMWRVFGMSHVSYLPKKQYIPFSWCLCINVAPFACLWFFLLEFLLLTHRSSPHFCFKVLGENRNNVVLPSSSEGRWMQWPAGQTHGHWRQAALGQLPGQPLIGRGGCHTGSGHSYLWLRNFLRPLLWWLWSWFPVNVASWEWGVGTLRFHLPERRFEWLGWVFDLHGHHWGFLIGISFSIYLDKELILQFYSTILKVV